MWEQSSCFRRDSQETIHFAPKLKEAPLTAIYWKRWRTKDPSSLLLQVRPLSLCGLRAAAACNCILLILPYTCRCVHVRTIRSAHFEDQCESLFLEFCDSVTARTYHNICLATDKVAHPSLN